MMIVKIFIFYFLMNIFKSLEFEVSYDKRDETIININNIKRFKIKRFVYDNINKNDKNVNFSKENPNLKKEKIFQTKNNDNSFKFNSLKNSKYKFYFKKSIASNKDFYNSLNNGEMNKFYDEGWIKYLHYENISKIENIPSNFFINRNYYDEQNLISLKKLNITVNNDKKSNISLEIKVRNNLLIQIRQIR